MRPISGKLQTFLEEKCDVFNYISVWGSSSFLIASTFSTVDVGTLAK